MRDLKKIEKLMKKVLIELGVPFDVGDVKRTPKRVAKTLLELTTGYEKQPPECRLFPATDTQVVIIKNMRFSSLCEHHMLVFLGTVSIAYIPNEHVIGLSKPARLVDYYSHKLMIQERFTAELTDELYRVIEPRALLVRVEAEHLCSRIRGVKSADSAAITYAFRSVFSSREKNKEFLYGLLKTPKEG